jgi:hypothetical protein
MVHGKPYDLRHGKTCSNLNYGSSAGYKEISYVAFSQSPYDFVVGFFHLNLSLRTNKQPL